MQQISQDGPQTGTPSANDHEAWIAGRVQVLLSHFYQPDVPGEVREAALDDWIEILAPISRPAIEHGCAAWLKDQPTRRPTPGDIRAKARGYSSGKRGSTGDRSALGYDDLRLLDEDILPAARRWLSIPGLAEKGRAILAYWGETP